MTTFASKSLCFRCAILQAFFAPALVRAVVGPLKGHSISSPPDINALANEWYLGGTAIPSTNNLVLGPGVPNRVGMLWSRYPLLTSDFEVSMTFTATKPEGARTVKNEGFALWYVYENVTEAQARLSNDHIHNQEEMIANQWDVAMRANGYDLLGYRNKFDGLGIIFCDDSTGAGAASTVVGDGSKAYSVGSSIPNAGALKFDYRGGKAMLNTLKVRVQKSGIKVEIGSQSFDLQSELKPGGYFGITTFGGKKGTGDKNEKSDIIELQKFEVTNHDANAEGENLPSPQSAAVPDADKEKVDALASSSSFRDHRSESVAIKELTDMVFRLVQETQPVRTEIADIIESLGKRIDTMESTFETLKVELDKKSGHQLGKEFESIKEELAHLSGVATKETEKTRSKLDSLHADVTHVHKASQTDENVDQHLNKLADTNQQTLDNISSGHQKMFGVTIGAIAFVIIAGLSLYNKFRCWERKHCL